MHFIIILHFAPPPVILSSIYHNRHYDFEMARFYIPALAKGYVIFDEAINIRLYPSFYTPFYPMKVWIRQNYFVTLHRTININSIIMTLYNMYSHLDYQRQGCRRL